jgi:hypothetical protein
LPIHPSSRHLEILSGLPNPELPDLPGSSFDLLGQVAILSLSIAAKTSSLGKASLSLGEYLLAF